MIWELRKHVATRPVPASTAYPSGPSFIMILDYFIPPKGECELAQPLQLVAFEGLDEVRKRECNLWQCTVCLRNLFHWQKVKSRAEKQCGLTFIHSSHSVLTNGPFQLSNRCRRWVPWGKRQAWELDGGHLNYQLRWRMLGKFIFPSFLIQWPLVLSVNPLSLASLFMILNIQLKEGRSFHPKSACLQPWTTYLDDLTHVRIPEIPIPPKNIL